MSQIVDSNFPSINDVNIMEYCMNALLYMYQEAEKLWLGNSRNMNTVGQVCSMLSRRINRLLTQFENGGGNV